MCVDNHQNEHPHEHEFGNCIPIRSDFRGIKTTPTTSQTAEPGNLRPQCPQAVEPQALARTIADQWENRRHWVFKSDESRAGSCMIDQRPTRRSHALGQATITVDLSQQRGRSTGTTARTTSSNLKTACITVSVSSPEASTATKPSLFVVFIVVFIDLLGFGVVIPVLPRYGEYFAASKGMLILLMSSFSAMQFLFAPLWGRLSDRIGRRPVLIVGLLGSTVCYSLFGYAVSLGTEGRLWGLSAIAWMLIARTGAGIAGATIATAQAYIADCTGATQRGRGMALIGAAFGLGFTFGPLLAAAFSSSDRQTPPNPMVGYAAAILSGLALLLAIITLKESLHSGSKPAPRRFLDLRALVHCWQSPVRFSALAGIFLTTFAFAQFEMTLALVTKALGMAERGNFLVFAYLGCTMMLCQGFLVRRLMPRVGERRLAMSGGLLLVLGLGLAGGVGHYYIGASPAFASPAEADTVADAGKSILNNPGVMLLLAVLPLSVMGFSAVNPSLQSILSLASSDEDQGAVLGLGQGLSALSRILGPTVGLALYSPRHVYWPHISAASVMLITMAILTRIPRATK